MDIKETNNVETPEISEQEPKKGMAIAALVCGICSIVCCSAWYISLAAAIAAIVLSRKVKKDNAGGQGMAKAGFICGIVGIVLVVVWVVFLARIFEYVQYMNAVNKLQNMPRNLGKSM